MRDIKIFHKKEFINENTIYKEINLPRKAEIMTARNKIISKFI